MAPTFSHTYTYLHIPTDRFTDDSGSTESAAHDRAHSPQGRCKGWQDSGSSFVQHGNTLHLQWFCMQLSQPVWREADWFESAEENQWNLLVPVRVIHCTCGTEGAPNAAPSRCGSGPSGPEPSGWLMNQLGNPSFNFKKSCCLAYQTSPPPETSKSRVTLNFSNGSVQKGNGATRYKQSCMQKRKPEISGMISDIMSCTISGTISGTMLRVTHRVWYRSTQVPVKVPGKVKSPWESPCGYRSGYDIVADIVSDIVSDRQLALLKSQ